MKKEVGKRGKIGSKTGLNRIYWIVCHSSNKSNVILEISYINFIELKSEQRSHNSVIGRRFVNYKVIDCHIGKLLTPVPWLIA